uniref:RuBisCO large subunit-binding protein subunit beta, chloroplastic n=1 Tax=Tanacetum cinerariifolium TaxID=118510 RepID=A0A699KVM6_TANCI|nr:RuBisCO large subunit-binding protein subunit beta, chloroplastic [Tanacetum cinerariifolium]
MGFGGGVIETSVSIGFGISAYFPIKKKLKVEDALNSTNVAVKEGIVLGGGCTLLRPAAKVNKLSVLLFFDISRLPMEFFSHFIGKKVAR